MLDDLFPVQFIEGINECAGYTVDDDYILSMSNFVKTAIEYKPTISSILSRVDILILTTEQTEANKRINASIYSDYHGSPSDIPLRVIDTFQMQVPGEGYQVYWQEIKLTPVVLVCNIPYWLVLDVDQSAWAFVLAKDGKQTNLLVKKDKRWKDFKEPANTKVMVRFFGRVIPFARVPG